LWAKEFALAHNGLFNSTKIILFEKREVTKMIYRLLYLIKTEIAAIAVI